MILREKECALNACVQIFCMTIHIISAHAVSLNISGLSKKADGPTYQSTNSEQKCIWINYTQNNLMISNLFANKERALNVIIHFFSPYYRVLIKIMSLSLNSKLYHVHKKPPRLHMQKQQNHVRKEKCLGKTDLMFAAVFLANPGNEVVRESQHKCQKSQTIRCSETEGHRGNSWVAMTYCIDIYNTNLSRGP